MLGSWRFLPLLLADLPNTPRTKVYEVPSKNNTRKQPLSTCCKFYTELVCNIDADLTPEADKHSHQQDSELDFAVDFEVVMCCEQ